MKRYCGGETVRGGYYWSLSRWEIVPVRPDVGPLPGPAVESYWALPLPAIPIVVAIMATVCAFYVPAIGFVMVFKALGAKLAGRRAPASPEKTADPSTEPPPA